MNQPTLDRMIKGVNALSLHCVTSVLNAFPELSAEWLLRGEGEMLREDNRSKEPDRVNSLIDTIATLQSNINALEERNRKLSNNSHT